MRVQYVGMVVVSFIVASLLFIFIQQDDDDIIMDAFLSQPNPTVNHITPKIEVAVSMVEQQQENNRKKPAPVAGNGAYVDVPQEAQTVPRIVKANAPVKSSYRYIYPAMDTDRTVNLGTQSTYMAYIMVTSTSSDQYKLRKAAQAAGVYTVDRDDGFALINGRICVATTPDIGGFDYMSDKNLGGGLVLEPGDYLDIEFSDGRIMNCIKTDTKSVENNWNDPQVSGGKITSRATAWGHADGARMIEWVYDHYIPATVPNSSYNCNHGTATDDGTGHRHTWNNSNHSEYYANNVRIKRITKVGRYDYVNNVEIIN